MIIIFQRETWRALKELYEQGKNKQIIVIIITIYFINYVNRYKINNNTNKNNNNNNRNVKIYWCE